MRYRKFLRLFKNLKSPKRIFEERFFKLRVIGKDSNCWLYTGPLTDNGYGRTTFESKGQTIHRLSAHVYLGLDLDSDAQVNHICINKHCFNPEHLYIGNQSQNVLDYSRIENNKPFCARGHKLTDIYTYTNKSGKRFRWCKKCRAEDRLRYRRRTGK